MPQSRKKSQAEKSDNTYYYIGKAAPHTVLVLFLPLFINTLAVDKNALVTYVNVFVILGMNVYSA